MQNQDGSSSISGKLLYWISTLSLWILSLRYKIEVKGADIQGKKGALILPNHPSQLDPFLLQILFFKKKIPCRPVAVEYLFQWSWLEPLLRLCRAISIPNFENSVNGYKMRKYDDAMVEIVNGLRRGDCFLFYPSGKVKKSAQEYLGGASGAYSLITQVPESEIILLRISGFWGSSFSRVFSKEMPNFERNLKRGLISVIKNAFFFTPRRKILIEIESAPKQLYQQKGCLDFNRSLEKWYNQYSDGKGGIVSEEPLQTVPLSRWSKKVPVIENFRSKPKIQMKISLEVQNLVYKEIARILNQDTLSIDPSMKLSEDLGMDSLSIADLHIFLSRRCKTQVIPIDELKTVQDVLEMADGHTLNQPTKKGYFHWPKEKDRSPLQIPLGNSLPEAIFNTCKRRRPFSICADDFSGVFSYSKFEKSIRILAEYFRKMPDERIGILLPASSTVFVILFAVQLSGKVPVVMNWTLGSRYLEKMVELSKVTKVIASLNFIDRLNNVDFGSVYNKFEFIENIRKRISLKTKVSGLLRKQKYEKINPVAVILFTSGSESAPKGVPLTHENILSNIRSVLSSFPFEKEHISLGVLPPFHSLGFTVAGMLPLLSGFRVAFFPDPTDPFALSEGINRWKVTHLPLAPSFLKSVLATATKEQLSTIKVFFCGGEKTPFQLREQVKSDFPDAHFIEGYGVTECSPCVAIGRPESSWKGVGPMIEGVEVMTLHPEDRSPLPQGREGEIAVSGPNVFQGYLGQIGSPFVDLSEKRWYCTGDLGFVDAEKNLILSGRLKRFIKLSGEMISLGAMEDGLTQELLKQSSAQALPFLAIYAEEVENERPRLILITKIPLSREQANDLLKQAGFSTLIRIDTVKQIDEIPVSLTGKIDYRHLSQSAS